MREGHFEPSAPDVWGLHNFTTSPHHRWICFLAATCVRCTRPSRSTTPFACNFRLLQPNDDPRTTEPSLYCPLVACLEALHQTLYPVVRLTKTRQGPWVYCLRLAIQPFGEYAATVFLWLVLLMTTPLSSPTPRNLRSANSGCESRGNEHWDRNYEAFAWRSRWWVNQPARLFGLLRAIQGAVVLGNALFILCAVV